MHQTSSGSLPKAFCWTRFGPEAGEAIEAILARKEAERTAGGGIFYWGIGNAIGPGLAALLTETREPEVLFSPIKGTPRKIDMAPPSIARWLSGEGLFGEEIDLPMSVCVTSRWDPARPNAPRYALVCASSEPLRLSDQGELRFDTLRNLSSGAPVGPSQVTAVVRREGLGVGQKYPVALRAKLVWPFALRLRCPVCVANGDRTEVLTPQYLRPVA